MAEEEKLEQVKAFSELRTGMLIVGRCDYCGGKRHRGQILPTTRDYDNAPVFYLLPNPAVHAGFRMTLVTPEAVAAGYIWRVADGYGGQEAYELAVLRDAAPKTVLRIRMGSK